MTETTLPRKTFFSGVALPVFSWGLPFHSLMVAMLFGGLGFAVHALWIVLIVALVLWVIGFFIGGASAGIGSGRRSWYGR